MQWLSFARLDSHSQSSWFTRTSRRTTRPTPWRGDADAVEPKLDAATIALDVAAALEAKAAVA